MYARLTAGRYPAFAWMTEWLAVYLPSPQEVGVEERVVDIQIGHQNNSRRQ